MADQTSGPKKTQAELDKEDEELLVSMSPEQRADIEKMERGEAIDSFPVDWEALMAGLPPEDRAEIEMIARGERIPGSEPLDLDALRRDIEERTKKKT